MDIQSIITSVSPVSPKAYELIVEHLEPVTYPKGFILAEEGKIEYYLYYMEKGIARAFNNRKGEEVTFWFGLEGSIICSMMNYIEKKPGYETIELLEESSLQRVSMDVMEDLYMQNIEWANWGRKYIEREIIKTENRLIEQQIMSATERYESLIRNHPALLQRVPLGIIASYLGITQVSLSRIRAKK